MSASLSLREMQRLESLSESSFAPLDLSAEPASNSAVTFSLVARGLIAAFVGARNLSVIDLQHDSTLKTVSVRRTRHGSNVLNRLYARNGKKN